MEKLYRDSLIPCEYDRAKYEKLIRLYQRRLSKLA
jgi:hypothetical protein